MMGTREALWVCTACGRSSELREDIADVSCYMNSVQVKADSVVRDEAGRVVKAEALDA